MQSCPHCGYTWHGRSAPLNAAKHAAKCATLPSAWHRLIFELDITTMRREWRVESHWIHKWRHKLTDGDSDGTRCSRCDVILALVPSDNDLCHWCVRETVTGGQHA